MLSEVTECGIGALVGFLVAQSHRIAYCCYFRYPTMSDVKPEEVAQDPTSVEIPIPIDPEPAPTKPEFVSETLYIQNLNEKIRIDGSPPSPFTYSRVHYLLQSLNHHYVVFSSLTARYSTW